MECLNCIFFNSFAQDMMVTIVIVNGEEVPFFHYIYVVYILCSLYIYIYVCRINRLIDQINSLIMPWINNNQWIAIITDDNNSNKESNILNDEQQVFMPRRFSSFFFFLFWDFPPASTKKASLHFSNLVFVLLIISRSMCRRS